MTTTTLSSVWTPYMESWITMDFHQGRRDRKHLLRLCQNPFLPLSLVQTYPHLPWDFTILQKHHPKYHDWYTQLDLSMYRFPKGRHGFFTTSLQIPQIKFTHRQTIDFVQWETQGHFLLRPFSSLPIRISKLSYCPTLPLSLVVKYWYRNWDYQFLFLYREWTIYLLSRLQSCRKILWKLLSRNVFLTLKIVDAFYNAPWDWNLLAKNPALPPHLVIHYPRIYGQWKWSQVFLNPRITPFLWMKLRTGISPPYPCRNDFPNAATSTSLFCTMVDDVEVLYDVFHKPYILLNHFHYASSLRLYAACHIQKFIMFHHRRRQLLRTLRFLLKVYATLPDSLFEHCMSFMLPPSTEKHGFGQCLR